MQHAAVWDGSLDSRQTIGGDGGIATSQDTQMGGDLPTAFGTAGYMDVNLATIRNSGNLGFEVSTDTDLSELAGWSTNPMIIGCT
jgi:hypothetical protein